MEEKLKKINRTLICNVTGKEIIVKPDKYERLIAYFQTEEKVKESFVCYQVENQVREPELSFWLPYCIEFKKFKNIILNSIYKYNESDRVQNDALMLQETVTKELDSNNIKEYIFLTGNDIKGAYITGLQIKLPFISDPILINTNGTK